MRFPRKYYRLVVTERPEKDVFYRRGDKTYRTLGHATNEMKWLRDRGFEVELYVTSCEWEKVA